MESSKANPNLADPVGERTLERFQLAKDFNYWMYQSIAPYCPSPCLEIGSGLGNISQHFIATQKEICLTDLRPHYCSRLAKTFEGVAVKQLDLVAMDFERQYAELIEQFASVYALNVVEHIEDDRQALENCCKLIRKGGNLVILVPAHQFLYNGLDEALGHYKRYSKKELRQLFEQLGLKVLKAQYWNAAAMAGWWWYGRIRKERELPASPLKRYNQLLPIIKFLDRCLLGQIGNSVLIVGQKN
ncbi:class I SAM-dependent methyltransferase [Saprospira grandis]|uniref:Glycosyl transferase family protein n=1 Tax=Saprospira grandis (strain Lewin) TaxID=984262 RepID=H6LA38_SAPGL|nr:class I SAM-dependent methyltransferase [Saprospira grandis]AFC25506.1 glycosyl transferase family protein [Saprospira grandis str. Lewin]